MRSIMRIMALFGLLAWQAPAEVFTGSTRAEVMETFGAPRGISRAGSKEIFTYAEGRVVLENGVVVRLDLKGRPVAPAKAAEQTITVAAKKNVTEGETSKPTTHGPEEVVTSAGDSEEGAAGELLSSEHSVRERLAFEASVEQLVTDTENRDPEAAAEELGLMESSAHFWLEELVGVLVQIGVGMVILKLAFGWADVHADWAQMISPATVAAVSGLAVRGVAYLAWGTQEVFYLDNAVSYLALLFTLLKTTHACTWQRAVGVAAAAKLMSFVVWVFLSVAISQALFA